MDNQPPTELIALIDRIIDVYDTPSGFLGNWAALLESQCDFLESTLVDVSTIKAIAAILQRAADDIDKALGI